jgi:hypothetical protein
MEPSRNFFITTRISTKRCIDKNNTNISCKKKKELYPLSARELNINNDNFSNDKYSNSNKNCIGVLKKNNKNKNKTFKNSLNETCINSILFSYTNSNKSKNKFIKKTQDKNNQNLIFSNFITKAFEERNDSKKKANCTMSDVRSLQRNKKKVTYHNYPISSNSNDIYSLLLNNFNSSLNNLSTRNNNNESISLNELKKIISNDDNNINNSNLIYTPNLRKKKGDTFYNSKNKKNLVVSNKSRSNKKFNNFIYDLHNNFNRKGLKHNEINKHKQHIKLNSTEMSTDNLTINFNKLTNNFNVNYNNSIITTTDPNKEKYNKHPNKNIKFKRIKNNLKDLKINKIDKLFLNNNKNNDLFPLALTEPNMKNNLFLPVNNYSNNAQNKIKK